MCFVYIFSQFLTFFFTNLNTWIQGEWSKIYDAAYVERVWIDPLLRWKPEEEKKKRKKSVFNFGCSQEKYKLILSVRWRPKIENLMDRLALMMTYQNELKKAPAKTTEPREFSLTKPKPPSVPLPELIPVLEKWKPVSEKNL